MAQEDGLKSWEKIHAVLSHPRCANCHTPDDHPRWGKGGDGAKFHAMNVMRGADGMGTPGMRCSTCHGEANAAKEHAPPGAHNWHLAPAEMVWFGQTSAQICAQIKDPLEERQPHARRHCRPCEEGRAGRLGLGSGTGPRASARIGGGDICRN